MSILGIIGGTGLTQLEGLTKIRSETCDTPFGKPSSPLVHGMINGTSVVFLARHGERHTIPPHRVNYRANLFALREAGVDEVVAVAAVGGISDETGPGVIAIPAQLIDYTWGRQHTYFEDNLEQVTHIDFTEPYCEDLRNKLLDAAQQCAVPVVNGGVYGATQGPRLETAAEIDRMARDGCTLGGMTGMPEAALARELGLCYAACAVVANRAAGRGEGGISMREIETTLAAAMGHVRQILSRLVL